MACLKTFTPFSAAAQPTHCLGGWGLHQTAGHCQLLLQKRLGGMSAWMVELPGSTMWPRYAVVHAWYLHARARLQIAPVVQHQRHGKHRQKCCERQRTTCSTMLPPSRTQRLQTQAGSVIHGGMCQIWKPRPLTLQGGRALVQSRSEAPAMTLKDGAMRSRPTHKSGSGKASPHLG